MKGLHEKIVPPLTLFTLLLLTKKIRISLEFDASGTGVFGGFLLVDTVLDFFKCCIVDYFHHKENSIREKKISST